MAEEETIKQWQKILDESSRYQIEDNETFLDLCHYTGERFEEICSRVLAFFLNPNKKHGFKNLWFRALCQTINDKAKIIVADEDNDTSQIEIKTEDPTKYADITNKRIDIMLKTPTLVIGIENKINAQLYNDLGQYKTHINEKYKDIKNKVFVVLTARTLNQDDSTKAKENKFIVIYYDKLFKNVTSSLDEYVSKGDPKYQHFMLDFIQTVKNRANIMEVTEMDKFFAANNAKIKELTEKYEQWKNKRWVTYLEKSRTHNDDLRTQIKKDTKAGNWWMTGDGRTIGINVIEDAKNGLLRVQSQFDFNDGNNPVCGICNIKFTLTQGCREYKDKISKQFPAITSDEEKNKKTIYLKMPKIELNNFENEEAYLKEIIDKLNECYDFLKEITGNKQSSIPENTGATS